MSRNEGFISMSRRSLVWGASTLLASLGLASKPTFGRESGLDSHQTSRRATGTVHFSDPGQPGTLVLELLWGEIEIRGHDRDMIEVDIKTIFDRPQAGDPDAEPKLVLREDQNTVSVQVTPPPQGGFWSANLDIRVPIETALRLGMERGGNIHVGDIRGRVEVDSKNGSVKLQRLARPARVECKNGEIEAAFSELVDEGRIHLATGNGKVDVTLPADTRADLDLLSPKGGVFSEFDLEKQSGDIEVQYPIRENVYLKYPEGGLFTGSLNGGGRSMHLATMNGPILIRRLG